jgi:hypothetical protein
MRRLMSPVGRGRKAEALFSQKGPKILELEPDQHAFLPLVHFETEFYERAIDSLPLARPIRIPAAHLGRLPT